MIHIGENIQTEMSSNNNLTVEGTHRKNSEERIIFDYRRFLEEGNQKDCTEIMGVLGKRKAPLRRLQAGGKGFEPLQTDPESVVL
ncbi:MAG: hypothetical protein WHS45_09600, partial [Anaerolinea sp.]